MQAFVGQHLQLYGCSDLLFYRIAHAYGGSAGTVNVAITPRDDGEVEVYAELEGIVLDAAGVLTIETLVMGPMVIP